MNTTTLFDLKQTASTAAVAALGKDPFTAAEMKLEAFNAAGHDKLDFPDWSGFYDQAAAEAASLKRIPSPAAAAAKP